MDNEIHIYPTALKVNAVLTDRARKDGTILGYRIETFPQLADRLARDLGSCREPVSELAERLVLEMAMENPGLEVPPLTGIFSSGPEAGGGAEHPLPRHSPAYAGLMANVLRLIREFKSAALKPQDLVAVAQELDPAAAARVRALAAIFSAYERELTAKNLLDRRERERAVVAGLRESEASNRTLESLADIKRITIAEIYDFSLQEFLIIASLIRMVGDARLTIQAQLESVNVSQFTERTWNRFVEDESVADMVLPEFINRGGRPGRLGHLIAHIFTETREEPPSADNTVEMFAAPDPEAEVEEIGRRIRRIMEGPKERRIDLDRAAIVMRNIAPYADHIGRVFRRYRIPVRVGDGPALLESPAARLALDILRLPLIDYSRESVIELARASMPPGRAAAVHAALLESGYIAASVRPIEQCLERLALGLSEEIERNPESKGRPRIENNLKRIAAASKALAQMLERLAPLENAASLEMHVRRYIAALEWFGFSADEIRASGRGERWLAGAARVLELLNDLARDAHAAGFKRNLQPEEFAAFVSERMAETALAVQTADLGGAVRVLSVLDARGLDFDIVFMAGVNDGFFPRYHSDDPVLPDRIRLALNRKLARVLRARYPEVPLFDRVLRTRRDYNNEERFLFFLGISAAERRLVISWSTSDGRDHPVSVSPFAGEAASLLGMSLENGAIALVKRQEAADCGDACFAKDELIARGARLSLLDHPHLPSLLGSPEHLASIARRADIEWRRYRYFSLPGREEARSRYSSPEKLAAADLYSGSVIADERLRALLFGTKEKRRAWSPGFLSDLASCGFKFFAARVLGISTEEQTGREMSAIEKGAMIHRVLHQLLSGLGSFDKPETIRRRAFEILKRLHDAEAANARDADFFEVQWRTIERIADEFIEWEIREWRDGRALRGELLLEHDFEITLARGLERGVGGDLIIKGRIDRLETDSASDAIGKIRVIDYKNSRSSDTYKDLLNPAKRFGVTEFQLAIYLMAALARYSERLSGETIVEAGYFLLRHRDKLVTGQYPPRLFEMEPSPLSAMQEEPALYERIIELAESALNGRFDVDPLRCDAFCPYRSVCRIGAGSA